MIKILTGLVIAVSLILSNPLHVHGQATGPVYIVQEGDTLYSIALRFNLTTDDLIDANSLTNPDALSSGDQLVIPGLEGVSGVLTSEIVPFGDNLTSLPLRHAISTAVLINLNHITSPSEVYAGANLILPQSESNLPVLISVPETGSATLLELAAIQGSDPWTTLVVNQMDHTWETAPGKNYFFPAATGSATGTGIHPSLESVVVKGMPLEQGRTISIEVISKEPVTLSGIWNSTELHFFSEEANHYFALQGIHAMLTPGLYPLSIRGTLGDGSTFAYEQLVAVQQNYRFLGNRGDQPEKLSVDQSGLDPAINDPENKLVQTMVSPANPVRFWNGIFTVPGYNRDWLTSRFGNRRIYNSDPKIYFHTGLDFEGGSGLPIKAAAPGTVIFAGPLTVRGNATFIDHGWGVYTAYYHQSEIQVSVGDKVAAGQQIGLVGATGLRLTGAHLHWEVWVNGFQVDPIDWLDIQYP